jgi:hypothetical protein
VICPVCRRDNQIHRRYCGGCGCNFDPACQGCGFANDHEDRFCGACGVSLGAEPRTTSVRAAAPSHVAGPSPMAALSLPIDELAGLFSTPVVDAESSALPERGIAQDDLDRLFGPLP